MQKHSLPVKVRPGLRIALLAGCLEAGKDGVGDYTRGLAEEASSAGVSVFMVAMNDGFIDGEQSANNSLRLAAESSWENRLGRLREALDDFDPDWVSLQFVPYSFQRRGWVHRLASRLRPLLVRAGDTKRRNLHVMFHELWLGAMPGVRWRHRLEGCIQRLLILRLLRVLQPALIQTSNPTYARALQRWGVEAPVLPLFGSVPIEFSTLEESWWRALLRENGMAEREDWWLFGVFGSMHPEWWPGEFFSAVLAEAAVHRRRLALVAVGRAGPLSEVIMARVEREFGDRVRVCRLGEQARERVAAVLGGIDFGISTSPWALVAKSSSTVAMREHGLPVIVTRTDEPPAGSGDPTLGDSLVLKFDATLPRRLASLNREVPRSRRPEITRQWLESLRTTLVAAE